VFHEGRGDNGWLWCNVFDGDKWAGDHKIHKTGITAGPSAVVYNDQIYLLHQGRDDSGWMWCNVFNGSEWVGDEEVPKTGISEGPGAVLY